MAGADLLEADMRRSGSTFSVRTIIAITAATAVAGCGPSTDEGGPTPSGGSSDSSPAADSPTGSGSSEPADPIEVPAPQPGPASPDSPPPYGWYASLQRGDCDALQGRVENEAPESDVPDDLQPIAPMYRALGELCELAQDQDAAVDWDAAAVALDDSGGLDNCLDVAARELLGAFVAAHDSDPEASVVLGGPQGGTACPTEISNVEFAGGDIAIEGAYLIAVDSILVNGAVVEINGTIDDSLDEMTLFVGVPCLDGTSEVDVEVVGDGYVHSRTGVTVPADFEQEGC